VGEDRCGAGNDCPAARGILSAPTGAAHPTNAEKEISDILEFAEFTPAEDEHVQKIIDRAVKMGKKHGVKVDRHSLDIDLSAAHRQYPLRLASLADADDFTFSHDVFGIIQHMDRATGTLGDCFIPRTAAKN
jgi:hypothetical protein